jgi:peptide deformylase
MGQKPTFIQINSGMRLQNQEFDNLSAVCHEHEIDQLNGMF